MLTFFRFILSYKREFHVNSRGIPLQDDNNNLLLLLLLLFKCVNVLAQKCLQLNNITVILSTTCELCTTKPDLGCILKLSLTQLRTQL